MGSRSGLDTHDLTALVSSTGGTTVYPNEETILGVLQTRFRADEPYVRIAGTTLVVVNPLKALASVNDLSAAEYAKLARAAEQPHLQPHVYELAARVYAMMKRTGIPQAVVFRGITGSGKSHTASLFSSQLVRLSARSGPAAHVADQLAALQTVLTSFGHAKTCHTASASRFSSYTELYFNSPDRAHLTGAAVLTFGLDKRRLSRLAHDERTFHVFYQLLAGATAQERDSLALGDMTDYALLASSGCYRLPAGPFSDDALAMLDLRDALKTLAFKSKHISAIWSLLAAILTLGNIQFADHGGTTNEARAESAYVSNPEVLEQAAILLGVSSEDLTNALTVRTNYVRRDLFTSVLNASECVRQTEQLAMDLYAILFAYVVESANHRIARDSDQLPESAGIIAMLDTPGFQARSNQAGTLLASALAENGFDEFCANFQAECINAFVLRQTFDDALGLNARVTADGISLPTVQMVDNSACVELLRGVSAPGSIERPGGVIGLIDKVARSGANGASMPRPNDLLQDMTHAFGVHASFISSPSTSAVADQALFGIAHYAGPVSYDVRDFVAKDIDTLDPGVLNVLRQSSEPFIEKLIAGPAVRVEMHARERGVVVRAQVGSRALRMPNPRLRRSTEDREELDPEGIYPVMTQISYALGLTTDALAGDGAGQDSLTGDGIPTLWNVTCIRPNDSQTPNSFDKRRVRAQIRALGLREMVERKIGEVVIGVPRQDGDDRYGHGSGWEQEGVEGRECVWLGYEPWKALEDRVWAGQPGEGEEEQAPVRDYTRQHDRSASGVGGMGEGAEDSLLREEGPFADSHAADWDRKASYATLPTPAAASAAPGTAPGTPNMAVKSEQPPKHENKVEIKETRVRKVWKVWVWMCTWWIPTFLLLHVGRMKRPDVQQAWREKVTICMMIFFACAFVIFYILIFGKLLCPRLDKAWNVDELSGHAGESDYWVAVRGVVYDMTNFWRGSHSDITALPSSNDLMQELWGQDLTAYFPVPLTLGCSGLVTDTTMVLSTANTSTVTVPTAVHTSGATQSITTSKLAAEDWYTARFLPKMDDYYKGTLVFDWKSIQSSANDGTRVWAVWDDNVYDLSDYFYTIDQNPNQSKYLFIDSRITDLFKQQPGQDITKQIRSAMAEMSTEDQAKIYACMKNVFYVGETDFRKTPRCEFAGVLLIVFAAILAAVIVAKFLAALQLTAKRSPEAMDKFVICQVPAYTEDEESLRRTIDSLTVLKYDDKRKLLFLICDGNIIGSGNDRTTPRIVLDILGVDPALDPEPLRFRSVGEGAKQLNYGKVYSGLYEFEGHVVPYIVVVKTGKPSETSKPGNRGKRDSQILLLHYLNRVHFDAPMSPLELEIYHQMRNVIGIDPAFYEYIFMVDADTTVTPDSLNRLVACAADDSQIIGICGETKLDNEEGSWWTMIQVYEYYISHHLAKAFESLFGSVTCLPGCFSMYRIRTADKGRPIIISNRIIDDYSEGIVDTLHKKNLLHLGEDRYLTTLIMKNFPTFKMKFTPDAIAHTIAPDRWSVLLSQRRRWINSTVHNLCELVVLPELCGICCFSMRFIVFLDLIGTIILPATVVYLIYLIVVTATGAGPLPLISIIMLAATYGLQAIIFLLKREFMLIGWMIIYLLAYPVYGFFLPVYSFWCMDDFSWGNTRVIQNDGSGKKVMLMPDDDYFDESMIPLKKFSEYEAEAWETGSHKSEESRHTGVTQAKSMSAQDFARRRAQETGFAASSYQAGSQTGDYYRDTNKMTGGSVRGQGSNLGHGPGLRSQGSNPNLQAQYLMPQFSGVGMGMGMGMPWMGSQAGSDYGGNGGGGSMQMGMMGMNPYMMGSMNSMGMVNNPYAASTMGGVPRNSVMTNLNMFGGSVEGQMTGNSGLGAGLGLGGGTVNSARPLSTFSMATSVNPLGSGPSQSTNPTDEELLTVLRHYLASQDLFTVTKKSAREAVMQRFPKADLTDRKDFLNKSIDTILTENA